jgi:large subunit ribosomal protein L30
MPDMTEEVKVEEAAAKKAAPAKKAAAKKTAEKTAVKKTAAKKTADKKPAEKKKAAAKTAEKKSGKMLKITLIKSLIGAVPKNKAIVHSMGFKKLNSTVILPDNAATRGQIRLIAPMVKVEEMN